MYAEILTIGDELCRGEIVDTNSSTLAARLWDADVTVRWMTSCRDDAGDIRSALAAAVGRADLVVCSGGLGPTEDDLTVDVVCEALGTTAEVEPAARARWESRFGGSPSPLQLRQLRVPTGARVWTNPAGAAPGFEVALGGVPVVCMPGVPRELLGIYDAGLGARVVALREARGDAPRIARRIFRVFGRGESQIAAAVQGVVEEEGASLHYQIKFPETLVKLVVRASSSERAEARATELASLLRERLGEYVYGEGDETLPERVARRLRGAGLTVATAESCTGGMIGELLTEAPGSSRYFLGGAIVYSNEEKVRQLGVAPQTLAEHGAVSEACVRELASGARKAFGSDLAVSVSGVAGPDGGTPDKPVGTVWLALARAGAAGEDIETRRLSWPGTRDLVRRLASWWALRMIDRALDEQGGAR